MVERSTPDRMVMGSIPVSLNLFIFTFAIISTNISTPLMNNLDQIFNEIESTYKAQRSKISSSSRAYADLWMRKFSEPQT